MDYNIIVWNIIRRDTHNKTGVNGKMAGIRSDRLITALLTAALAVFSAGCSRTEPKPEVEEDSKPAESTVKPDDTGNIQMMDYTVPELLIDAPKADVLADVKYKSFEPAAVLTEPERQPINGYKCTGFFNNMCYIYKEGDSYGVLSLSGEILLEAGDITKITAESPEIISVRRLEKPRELYHVSYEGLTPIQAKKFDISRISFEPSEENESGLTLRVDGRDLYSGEWAHWRTAEPINLNALDTVQEESDLGYEAVFLAENSKGKYYLAFDKYFNLTVCAAELGYAELKIGGLYGRYYITDATDFEDLSTLVSSFGDDRTAYSLPKGDSGSDYIRIVLGRDDDEQKIYTISPDGFCFAEVMGGENMNRYFRRLSSETYTDLVYWVDKKLSKDKQ